MITMLQWMAPYTDADSLHGTVAVPFLQPDDHVVMVDCKGGQEGKEGKSIYNEAEALLIMRYCFGPH